MSVLLELHTFLTALGSLGTLKMAEMPESPDAVGVLYEYGGLMSERRFGVVGVGYEHPSIQIVFRGLPYDYANPRAKAEIAHSALMSVQPGALGGSVATIYHMLTPQQPPFQIRPNDKNQRHHIGFNCYIKKEPS